MKRGLFRGFFTLTLSVTFIGMAFVGCESNDEETERTGRNLGPSSEVNDTPREKVGFDDRELDEMALGLKKTAAEIYHEEHLEKARTGDPKAMFQVGSQFYGGYGCTQSYEKAYQWWKAAAEKGEIKSFNNVGYCYKEGDGVEQDLEESVKWFHKGSEKGDSFAMRNLAGSYLEGKGVKKNHELAIEWYEKSAELGYIEAMRDLHHLYNDGEIVPKDAEKAEHWKLKFFEANLKEGGQ